MTQHFLQNLVKYFNGKSDILRVKKATEIIFNGFNLVLS